MANKIGASRDAGVSSLSLRRTSGLLGGVSVATLMALQPAFADLEEFANTRNVTSPIQRSHQGDNGRDASVPFIGSNVDSTRGLDGRSYKFQNTGTVRNPHNGTTTLNISSTGGNGGNGDISVFGGTVRHGSVGGNGGNIHVEQRGLLQADRLLGHSMVSLISRGGKSGTYLAEDFAFTSGKGGDVYFLQAGQEISATPWSGAGAAVRLASYGGEGSRGAARDKTHGSGKEISSLPGSGGAGGKVAADIQSNIYADGDTYVAVHATSRGGDGGVGGTSVFSPDKTKAGQTGPVSIDIGRSADVSTGRNYSPSVIAEAIGGNGGNVMSSEDARGSDGGSLGGTRTDPSVRVSNWGKISTSGIQSAGIIAQSVGGSGGGGQIGLGHGGDGGNGGNGGYVLVDQGGSILTRKERSYGIVAQSVGGGGGGGGNDAFVGGKGGNAGNGGEVFVNNTGTITTYGGYSTGVVAQSVGGGKALNAFNAILPSIERGGGGAGGEGGFLFFGKGGAGGLGGVGGTVTVNNSGTIKTDGANAMGILAQSVGGGGGGGGKATAFGFGFSAALGGDGGKGGRAQDATVNNLAQHPNGSGYIETKGDNAIGIMAQSVGGGGGVGGGATAVAVGAQLAIAIGIGGSGGEGGTGGNATVNNGLKVSTHGKNAAAIFAQSVGGGGGHGGDALAVAAAAGVVPKLPNITIAHAVGGNGGKGNTAGHAKVVNSAALLTTGDNSAGISAMSIGGGGGSGGTAQAASVNLPIASLVAFSVSSALGGDGAEGGVGGKATIENSGAVTTTGNFSSAITAYSIGGGGGEGGDSQVLAKDFLVKKGVALTTTHNYGGTGGKGNTGGEVKVSNTGTLVASGVISHGIEAVSIGGGGGRGGDTSPLKIGAVSYAAEFVNFVAGMAMKDKGTNYSGSYNRAIGGHGGEGAVAGTVTVDNSGAIRTMATAIQAQSIGGGGGNGGAGSVNQSSNVTVNKAIGGNGGKGGDGNTVTVTTTGNKTISTVGDAANAIFAQSIGGGGGHGGYTSAQAGGSGIVSNQYVATLKGPVKAALVDWLTNQSASVRGNVGNVLHSLTPSLFGLDEKAKKWATTAKQPSMPVSMSYNSSVGGTGGAAGDGKKVTVTNAMNLSTAGDASSAIFAQSVGGGGGHGGASEVGSEKLIDIKHAIGGSGAAGGKGGEAIVDNSGTISTMGMSSFGIVAQSIGGGGGTATMGVDLQSGLAGLPSMLIPTLANANLKHFVGGSGGAGGAGDHVTVTSKGAINTAQGGEAHGIVAQSIGGGGGLSVMNFVNPHETLRIASALEEVADAQAILENHGINLADEKKAAQELIAQNRGLVHTQTIELGGNHASGAGGQVDVTLGNKITTGGKGAIGIVAQSIGGGGGLISAGGGGGASYRNKFEGRLGGLGSTGDAGAVKIDLDKNASIVTRGDGATGILAQSIGGGGGYVGSFNSEASTLGLLLKGSKDNNGSGKNITIRSTTGDDGKANTFNISTTGVLAHGIVAQSLGGGGGFMAQAVIPDASTAAARQNVTGGSGEIYLSTKGDISARGWGSYGIFAQTGIQKSDGSIDNSHPSGRIQIYHDGVVSGGDGTGAGIRLDGGVDNVVYLDTRASLGASSGVAIIGSENRDTVTNYGYVIGDILLARGKADAADVFHNKYSGTYISAINNRIDLGANGVFYNSGKFDIGRVNRLAYARLTGKLELDTLSTVLVDVSSVGFASSDMLHVSGSAILNGKMQVNAVEGLRPNTFEVLTADGGISGKVTAVGPGTWNAINWTANNVGNTVTVTPTANFTVPTGMIFTPAEDDVRTGLQDIWDNYELSDTGARLFAGLAQVGSEKEYRDAIDSLSPEESASNLSHRGRGARHSMAAALSCPVFENTGANLRESECAWARISAAHAVQDDTAAGAGYNRTSGTMHMGAQKEIAENWYLGGAAGYTWSRLSDHDRFSVTDGHSFDASVSLKHQMDAWQFGVVGHLGYGAFDTTRVLAFGPSQWHLQGKSHVFTAGTRLRAAHQFTFDNWYVRPYADLDLIYTRAPAHREHGAFASMSFDTSESWNVAFSPNIEFGARLDIDETTWARPFASVGLTTMVRNGTQVSGSLNLGAGDDSFSFNVGQPNFAFNVGAGLQLYRGDGVELRGEYKASFAPNYVEQEGTIRLSVPF